MGWHRLGLIFVLVVVAFQASADDRHAGYYYPDPGEPEVYQARAETLTDSDRTRRIGFIVQLTEQMFLRPYAPEFAIFAKGEDAEKMIIVSLREGYADTLYRARAILAQLTAISRGTPLMQNFGVAEHYTFFDLLVLMGFSQLTISDGDDFAHQVVFE